MTFGSLFAGIGGIDLGLERAGMRCAWQVEIDDYATRVLHKHWPNVPKFRDVRSVGAHNLPSVDLIAGGFPCQDISNAGRRAGITGERSGLWFEFARIIRELRPRYVLVENVSALLHRGIDTVLGDMAALGYDAEWHCIPAAAVGAPHLRDRICIVAYTQSERRQPQPGSVVCGADAGVRTPQREVIGRSSERTRVVVNHAPAREWAEQWSTEPTLDRVADGVPARVDRLRGLGNAVVPQVAEFVGRQIVIMQSSSG